MGILVYLFNRLSTSCFQHLQLQATYTTLIVLPVSSHPTLTHQATKNPPAPETPSQIPSGYNLLTRSPSLQPSHPPLTKPSLRIPSLKAPRELLSPKRNLIPEQNLCRRALPSPVPARGDHKRARGVEVQLRDDACAVAGDDEERGGGGVLLAVCAEGGGGGVVEVVLAEDVVRGAGGGR
jgi:hypothetical protein